MLCVALYKKCSISVSVTTVELSLLLAAAVAKLNTE